MSPAQLSAPLPECQVCEQPTRRQVHERTGGFCTECAHALVVARSARYTPRRRR